VSPEQSEPEAESVAAIQGKAGTYTVSMSDWGDVWTTTPPQLELNGSSSRNLTFASAWVPDDVHGLTTWSARQFSVLLRDGYEINSVISGLPLYVDLKTTTGTPNDFTARLLVHPGFYPRSGTSAMALAQTCTPIRVRDSVDPLRYRASVVTNQAINSVDLILPDSTRIAGVVRPNSQYIFDLTFTQIHAALGQTVTIEAIGPTRNYLKYGVLNAKVEEVQVTSGDASVVWPEPSCEPAVRTCLEQYPAELAECGNYFQVSGCGSIEPCLLDGSPFALEELPDAGLMSAETAYNAGSGNGTGFYWTDVAATGFEVEGCGTTLEDIVNEIVQNVNQQGLEFSQGDVTDRDGFEDHLFSTSGYSSGGPQLFSAVTSFGGQWELEAWTYVAPVQCHNCTQYEDWVVVYFPLMQRAVLLVGGHGYDS
jgi:hypothetical protein